MEIKTQLCAGITDEEYSQMSLCGGMRKKQYAKGQVIFRMGQTTSEVGIVLSGSVNIENIDICGNRSILSNVQAGQVFAETYAYCKEPLMVDVAAAEDTEVLFWNLDVLLCTPHAENKWQQKLERNLLNISVRKNLALSERIFCTAPKTVRGRLLVYLSNQSAKAGSSKFKIPFDRQGLADYLNLDRSALSKELGKMRDEGILETRKNEFVLHKLPE